MTGSSYDGFLKSGIIEDTVLSRDWSLNDVLNMDNTVDSIVQELIDSMDSETKYLIVKDTEFRAIHKEMITVGEIISIVLREELSDMVSFIVNQYLKEAKVSFNDNNNTKPEVVEEVVEEKEPTQEDKIMTLKERIRQDTKQLDDKDKKELGMI
jgi:hypothetical protein